MPNALIGLHVNFGNLTIIIYGLTFRQQIIYLLNKGNPLLK